MENWEGREMMPPYLKALFVGVSEEYRKQFSVSIASPDDDPNMKLK
jgi:hypothetical protein